ncbi:MAG TPA: hypothetical protein VNJ52_06585 [Patescibacteria group bacterium]|nr:hypothetical protein [Patescibacteria group bacterium]
MWKGKAEESPLSRERRRRLRSKTIVFLLLMALLGPSSNILFRAGMERMGALSAYTPAAFLVYGWRMLNNGWLVLGTFVRILFTVVSLLVLSWADYSFVTPASSINFAIVALMGSALLGETVSLERWIGIGIICVGVALVGITPASTTALTAMPESRPRNPALPGVRQENTEIC